ncbi:MAG: lysylphosphatidylglycerol synthase transmembrane domain-containing protein [Saprospiraceae bacterium]
MTYRYTVIKIVSVLLILWIIYYQLSYGEGLPSIIEAFHYHRSQWRFAYLAFMIGLMPVNWWLEAKKWQILMSPVQSISFYQASRSILAGLSVGIVTPARIGEYGGRLLTTDPSKKTEVISATFLGSIAQNLCNIIVGLGFSYFFLKSLFDVTYVHTLTFYVVVIFQIGILLYLYYNLPKVVNYLDVRWKFKYFKSLFKQLGFLNSYTLPLLHQVLGISMVRYIIYFIQYVLMIKFLGADVAWLDLLSNISGIYLIQTGIPLPAFLSVFARGELAVMVWSTAGIDQLNALVATFGLWMVNLILPSLVGLVVLYGTDLKRYFTSR